MKFYDLETQFTFGKYNGLAIAQVIAIQPAYISWCLNNLDHFFMSKEIQYHIKTTSPDFDINEGKMFIKTTQFHDFDDDDGGDYDYDPSDDFTDWSNYNDDLDMDQQSIEFWNQF
jgi:hypothetical protein